MKKIIHATLLIVLSCTGSLLYADVEHIKHCNDQERDALSKLKHHLVHLKDLALGIEYPSTRVHVYEVIRYSQKVLKARCKATPRRIEKALKATLKAIDYLEHTTPQNNKRIEPRISQHFSQIQGHMQGILALLQANATNNLPVPISSLPYTISHPGKYYVPQNLTYSGAQTAITVSADNVSLNFYNNSLTLTNQNAVGVLVQNVKEFTLENAIIQGSLLGVHIVGSSGNHIENSFLNGAGIVVDSSHGVTIDTCSFEGTTQGAACALTIQNAAQHSTVTNSTFSNWPQTIVASQVTGLQIDACLIKGSGTLLTLGADSSQANDIQIRNTTFEQLPQTATANALEFLNGSGCLLESVIIDAASVHAIHVGSIANSLLYDNVLAKGCIVIGSGDYALYIENGTSISCLDCQFTRSETANVFFGSATGCLLQNCNVSSGGKDGVVLSQNAQANAVVNCEISNNGQNGIVIEQAAKNNQIINNNVFDNANFGIFNSEASTATFYNMSCNNSVSDCPSSGVAPEQAPGVSALVPGSNICCAP